MMTILLDHLGTASRRAGLLTRERPKRGLVGPSNGAKDREVLIDAM
jgi:hypothetical protein